jgi:taurine dioxygenase
MLGVNKFDADGKLNLAIYRRGADGWHTDGAYNRLPFKATQLYTVVVPEPPRRYPIRQWLRRL